MKRTKTIVLFILLLTTYTLSAQHRVAIQTSTGRLLESADISSTPGTLTANQSQFHSASDITEKIVTENEYKSLRADLDAQTKASAPTLATNATTGFFEIPVVYGTPTGTPDTAANKAGIAYDKKNKRLFINSDGWHYIQITN